MLKESHELGIHQSSGYSYEKPWQTSACVSPYAIVLLDIFTDTGHQLSLLLCLLSNDVDHVVDRNPPHQLTLHVNDWHRFKVILAHDLGDLPVFHECFDGN